jgi:hypothetical protein
VPGARGVESGDREILWNFAILILQSFGRIAVIKIGF